MPEHTDNKQPEKNTFNLTQSNRELTKEEILEKLRSRSFNFDQAVLNPQKLLEKEFAQLAEVSKAANISPTELLAQIVYENLLLRNPFLKKLLEVFTSPLAGAEQPSAVTIFSVLGLPNSFFYSPQEIENRVNFLIDTAVEKILSDPTAQVLMKRGLTINLLQAGELAVFLSQVELYGHETSAWFEHYDFYNQPTKYLPQEVTLSDLEKVTKENRFQLTEYPRISRRPHQIKEELDKSLEDADIIILRLVRQLGDKLYSMHVATSLVSHLHHQFPTKRIILDTDLPPPVFQQLKKPSNAEVINDLSSDSERMVELSQSSQNIFVLLVDNGASAADPREIAFKAYPDLAKEFKTFEVGGKYLEEGTPHLQIVELAYQLQRFFELSERELQKFLTTSPLELPAEPEENLRCDVVIAYDSKSGTEPWGDEEDQRTSGEKQISPKVLGAEQMIQSIQFLLARHPEFSVGVIIGLDNPEIGSQIVEHFKNDPRVKKIEGDFGLVMSVAAHARLLITADSVFGHAVDFENIARQQHNSGLSSESTEILRLTGTKAHYNPIHYGLRTGTSIEKTGLASQISPAEVVIEAEELLYRKEKAAALVSLDLL